MRAARVGFTLLAVFFGASAQAADIQTGTTPFYLPRAIWAGTFIHGQTVTPQVRVQWEGMLIQQYRDVLAVVMEVGGGYGVRFPTGVGINEDATMTYLYQHSIVAGIGYRGWRFQNFRWGVQILLGPHFYGARYDILPKENRVNGMVEGRARFGWDLGPVSVGASVGYASPFSRPFLSAAAPHLGGFMAGAYVDWWH